VTIIDDNGHIKGVIFDLDGTLIDSYEAIYQGFHHAYTKMGFRPLSYDQVKKQVGHSLEYIFRELLGEQYIQPAIILFRQRYEEVFRTHTHLLPNAADVVKAIYDKGIKLAVATNKLGKSSRAILEHLQLSNFFSAIIGEGDGTRNKPDPEMLYLAIEKMAIPKDNAIMVGDSTIDIQAAHNARIRVYAVASGMTSREELAESRPTEVITSLNHLLKYI